MQSPDAKSRHGNADSRFLLVVPGKRALRLSAVARRAKAGARPGTHYHSRLLLRRLAASASRNHLRQWLWVPHFRGDDSEYWVPSLTIPSNPLNTSHAN
jgi:hypothetical protein